MFKEVVTAFLKKHFSNWDKYCKNKFLQAFITIINDLCMPFLKIRNLYVSEANSRLLLIPNDTKTIKHLLKRKISKISSKVAVGVANTKIVKTANPTWKSV